MKKKSFRLLGLSLIVLIGLVVANCSKNQSLKDDNSTGISSAENSLILRINNFQKASAQQMEGVFLKSGNKITIDSARYYIGTTIKYTYCFPTSVYNQTIWDTTFISFPVDENNGDVLYDDAVTAYNNCVDSLKVKYRAISDTTKKLIGVVLQDLGTNALFKRDIRVIAQFGTGSSSYSLLDGNADFDEEDEYIYRNNSSKCDGTGSNGAPDIFENETLFKYRPVPVPGYHVWFEEGGEIFTPLYSDYVVDVVKDNYLDYLIFYAHADINTISAETKCLEYNQNNLEVHEMDFYLDGSDYIIYDWLENDNPNGLSFETCAFSHSYEDDPVEEFYHVINIVFSIKHVTINTIGNFPIPLDD